jgi:hypothetical protein
MILFPDVFGGGWTHFRRFELFPYYWGLLFLAFLPFSAKAVVGLMSVGASAGIALLSSTAIEQDTIRNQMAPLAQVDRLVGSHCSVLPIVLESHPVDAKGHSIWLTYEPYFQSTSRLELTDDRVVLFNFLARLDPYPIHFRPNIEPQSNVFHWKLEQGDTRIEVIDVDSFEKSAGMPIDYILIWGDRSAAPEGLKRQVVNAIATFSLVYKSPNGQVELYYHRNSNGNDLCVVSNLMPEPHSAGQ